MNKSEQTAMNDIFSMFAPPQNHTQRLIYIYDALCGWCYGFSPVMKAIAERYRNQLDIAVLSGGMITGEREGPIGVVAPYIKSAYVTVEQTTGVRFGEQFLQGVLEQGTAYFSSVKPALALATFRHHKLEQSLAFAHALHTAIYYDGIEPNETQHYGRYAASFGLDASAFVAQMLTPQTHAAIQAEFHLTAQLGISGFPTLLLQDGEQLYLLTQGYVQETTLTDRINALLERIAVPSELEP
jgi:putative protein-disulfide isomerase